MDGLIVVNKPCNCTSRDVVNEIGKIFKTKKVGHTGTLDPMATGVLVVCIGKATKLVDMITSDYKEYVAGVRLGILTDTLDITGNVLKKEDVFVDRGQVISVLSDMIGFYEQEVPYYSAVKVNGKKLYEYARNNIDVTLPKRMVEIRELSLVSDISYDNGNVNFLVKCVVSKGTYIRSLIRDMAFKLNTVGSMSSLCRTRQGNFKVSEAYTLEQIKNNDYSLIGVLDYLGDMYRVKVDDRFKQDILNGKVLKNIYNRDILFVDSNDLVLAIYRVSDDDSSKIKPYKMFGGVK